MNALMSLSVPLILAATSLYAALKHVDVYSAAVDGARDGVKTVLRIFPSLVILFTAVYMLRASGVFEQLSRLLAPLFALFGIPPELAPLMLIRPISGSAALAIGTDIIMQYGADSLIGKTAAIMLGSTETTFYVIAVYFGAVKVKKTRYAIPCALAADFTGFLVSALTAKIL